MELYEIKNGLEDARLLLDQLYVSANIEVLKREIEGLTVQTMDEHFWDDQAHATKVYAHLNEMKKVADTDDSLEESYKELVEVYEYVKDTEDPDFMASLEEDYIKFADLVSHIYTRLEKESRDRGIDFPISYYQFFDFMDSWF